MVVALLKLIRDPMRQTERLRQIYYDTNNPASFSRPEVLARASGVEIKAVRKWLKSQPTYTLHKNARKRFPTRKYVVNNIDSQWQADLADMQQISKYNKGYKYMLTVIDILSRSAWARPMKSKFGHEVAEAFDSILSEGRIPERIQTDQGKEFENVHVSRLMDQYHIEMFSVKSAYKAAMVERFNRTIKTKLWRYFTARNTYKWIDVLPSFMEGYNNSYHRSIKMKPADVNPENAMEVWLRLYGSLPRHVRADDKISVGDRVRISKVKSIFEKGYLPNWSEEEFFVDEINIKFKPTMYKLIDYHGNRLDGSFYAYELQVVEREEESFIIDQIIRRRRRGNQIQYLVKWRGYPDSFNSWVTADDLRNVNVGSIRNI